MLHVSKVATLILMHICIFKESKRGLKLIHYIGKNEEKFNMPVMAYLMGIIQTSSCFAFEIVNIIILFTRPCIRLVLACYVNVEIIYVVNKRYYENVIEADEDDNLKQVFDECN